MSSTTAAIAVTRFGLGPRPGELKAVSADPRGWLLEQLRPQVPVPRVLSALPPSHQIAAFRSSDPGMSKMAAKKMFREASVEVYRTEAEARFQALVDSATPFRERLILLLSNHFTVSVQRNIVRGLVGSFEREVVRKHVCGRFADMLTAATAHPAMLLYLDNHQSVGPNSRRGTRGRKGLNENLAREILELHTLGVDGGYTQADVEALACVLTGWGVARPGADTVGGFQFRSFFHEPGPKTVVGLRVREGGRQEGIEVLRHLAAHPSTAAHLATKMVRHFVSDAPPPNLVKMLTRTYLDSGGDLAEMGRVLVSSARVWKAMTPKLRTPLELSVAAGRALGLSGAECAKEARKMHQAPWAQDSPAGWPDTTAAWLGPEAMLTRVDWAERVARRVVGEGMFSMRRLMANSPAVSAATQGALAGANHPRKALAVWLLSSENQWR